MEEKQLTEDCSMRVDQRTQEQLPIGDRCIMSLHSEVIDQIEGQRNVHER